MLKKINYHHHQFFFHENLIKPPSLLCTSQTQQKQVKQRYKSTRNNNFQKKDKHDFLAGKSLLINQLVLKFHIALEQIHLFC